MRAIYPFPFVVVLLLGCSSGLDGDSNQSSHLLNTASLVVSPATANLGYSQSLQLAASGGSKPYHFYISSGVCSVEESGIVHAGTQNSTCVVSVYDAAGTTGSSSLTISGDGGSSGSCLFNGSNVANGSSVTAYQTASVSAGSNCVSETRTCNNGVLSGSYQYSSCQVGGGGGPGGGTGRTCNLQPTTQAAYLGFSGEYGTSTTTLSACQSYCQSNPAITYCQWFPNSNGMCLGYDAAYSGGFFNAADYAFSVGVYGGSCQ